MAEKLIMNAVMNCKADCYEAKKCVVEKVIDVYETEFKKMLEKPMERNYHLVPYRSMMGFYDNAYHCVLMVDQKSGDGLLVNSEGSDYARYSQYIPNAKDIIWKHEQSLALDDLKTHMDRCINNWLEQHKNESEICVSMAEFFDDSSLAEILSDYVSESLSNHPQIESCDIGNGFIKAAKRELTETKLYCPLTFCVEPDDDNCDLEEVDSLNYVYYDDVINKKIRQELWYDEEERERGLIAYTDNEHLAQKVYSVFPSVETRDGDLYGVVTIQSYGELDKAELIELTEEVEGSLSDGFGEHFEQQKLYLGEDKVFMSFWSSDDNYFIKPESEVFPEQKFEQTMGGM